MTHEEIEKLIEMHEQSAADAYQIGVGDNDPSVLFFGERSAATAAALRHFLQAQEWKPIESAPIDLPEGTPLIFSNASRDLIFVEWCENGADEDGNHWSGFVEMDGTALDDDYEPTCFFALPLPPQSIEEADVSEASTDVYADLGLKEPNDGEVRRNGGNTYVWDARLKVWMQTRYEEDEDGAIQ